LSLFFLPFPLILLSLFFFSIAETFSFSYFTIILQRNTDKGQVRSIVFVIKTTQSIVENGIMALTRQQLIIIGSIATVVVISLVVGVGVGVVVGRRKPTPITIEEQVFQILANNPLIDG
jgi:hypothetical protein